jgi:hypothetical protein
MKVLKEVFRKYDPEQVPVMEFPTHAISINGQYFLINQAFLDQAAPSLAKQLSVRFIVNEADLWIKSTTAICSIVLWILLLSLQSWLALIPVFLLFLGFWHTQKAALYVPSISSKLHWLANDLVWFAGSSFVLSFLASAKDFTYFGIGLTLLFLLRASILQRLLDWVYTKLFKLSLNDRLVQFIIMKQCIYRGIAVFPLNEMVKSWQKKFNK